jgi:nucleoside phosphorylase
MLDLIHEPLSQPQTDQNTYTLGTLGGHNVATACLPSGVYGTTSAAIVLSHMVPTFPCLQFGLMVGIGGGVPSESADIRLGDVVVSMATATSGGVIQYDYGKTLCDERFQWTGSPNNPPHFLLTVVSKIRSNYMMGEKPIQGIIRNILQKHQGMREQFSSPEKDWLFNSKYTHQSSNTECSECDQSQLVGRNPRATDEPHIHYGLIASGNQVMKDAERRDSIAQVLDILCDADT